MTEEQNLNAWEDFNEREQEQVNYILSEYDKGYERINWKIIPAARLVKLYQDFAATGFVNDEDFLYECKDIILTNIVRLDITNRIGGHDSYNPNDYLELMTDRVFTDEEVDKLNDFLVTDDGSWLVSDYGLPKLYDLYPVVFNAANDRELLIAIDRVLQVTHPRSDLAELFVETGSAVLNKIFLN